mmetsp:Transcript_16001/g.31644  ORF Transcript_16001/g.31644 Transcript_16001/m.31644 type:complete len:97 (-) Transcript_16001:127-417(-)|eukprot:CAMPEP_0173389602 /NCGR_PEP_ID=MMETSP1356-20130122/12716_1 /TAXON_ID=77927 ORGANISM="Hemiselmis virescens, Strain PCC157" /NCGR_SAMPLE_ID=MMETSP1356 /ASSEMBLY_ACC=CAM_ASM_000847 /LENGTH=96 /DNA_ID=CAMNT_0014346809 /DNA_START=207 /DNA_END=497 /DNA_ORIENTATION=+
MAEGDDQQVIETGNWMMDALLKPGSSMSPLALGFLDKIFYVLFLCIIFLMWLTDFTNLHTYIFMFLACGLFASVKFFVSELKNVQAAAPGQERKDK